MAMAVLSLQNGDNVPTLEDVVDTKIVLQRHPHSSYEATRQNMFYIIWQN
jgi:hypothetical protein